MLREIFIDYGVSSSESYLPKAKPWGWLLAIKSLCFSKLISYFLSSSTSLEVALYPWQMVGFIMTPGLSSMDLSVFEGLGLEKGFGWNRSLRPCNSYHGVINGVIHF